MNGKIGIFDSGIGGLTILEELKQILPHEQFIYYQDSKNNPYGEKDEESLFKIVTNIVEFLIDKDCKLIVIACNTATVKCMKKLKKIYSDIIFVGTVPAIKPACEANYKNILVMATPVTIKSTRTKELIDSNKKDYQNIYLVSCEGLANAIETKNNDLINKLLHKFLDSYQTMKIDAIVLGCTHYPLIKHEILEVIPTAQLIDSSRGVAKEVKHQLELNKILGNNHHQTITFYTSVDISINN